MAEMMARGPEPAVPAGSAKGSSPEGLGIINDFQGLYDVFNVEKSSRTDKAMSKIWDYLKREYPDKSHQALKVEAARLKNRLGIVGYGDRPYSKVEIYVDAQNRINEGIKTLEELDAGL